SLLGLDHLSRFRIGFDLQNNHVTLLKGNGFAKPSPTVTSGMSILQDRDVKVVVRVKPNSAAAEAGISPGDRLRKVDGVEASDIDMFELRELLTHGPERTINLEIQ